MIVIKIDQLHQRMNRMTDFRDDLINRAKNLNDVVFNEMVTSLSK
jgi:hypothetical protein